MPSNLDLFTYLKTYITHYKLQLHRSKTILDSLPCSLYVYFKSLAYLSRKIMDDHKYTYMKCCLIVLQCLGSCNSATGW